MKLGAFTLAFCVLLVVGPAPRSAEAATPGVAYPHGDKLEVKGKDGSPLHLKEPEKVAFLMLMTIDNLEDQCQLLLNKFCTLEELVHGMKTSQGMLGLKVDPARDQNYTYAVGVSGKVVGLSARPKKPGLGGWLWIHREFGGQCYFNPHGPATAKSQKLGGYSFTGIDLTRDAMPGGSEATW